MFIINIIDAYSYVYYTYNIRENLKLGFVVKVVAGLRGFACIGHNCRFAFLGHVDLLIRV